MENGHSLYEGGGLDRGKAGQGECSSCLQYKPKEGVGSSNLECPQPSLPSFSLLALVFQTSVSRKHPRSLSFPQATNTNSQWSFLRAKLGFHHCISPGQRISTCVQNTCSNGIKNCSILTVTKDLHKTTSVSMHSTSLLLCNSLSQGPEELTWFRFSTTALSRALTLGPFIRTRAKSSRGLLSRAGASFDSQKN